MSPEPAPATTKALETSHNNALKALQSFPFLKLPAELRNKIYRSLLVFDRVFIPKRSLIPSKFVGTRCLIDFAIIGVNKQVYSEARGIWLKENEFIYREEYDTYRVPHRSELNWRIFQQRFIGRPDILKHASRIRVEFGTYDMIADFVETLVSNQNLIYLGISFRPMTMKVLMACKKALHRLEKVSVCNEVSFKLQTRTLWGYRRKSDSYIKKERAFENYLSTLKAKMLENGGKAYRT
ncbi:hypothetical protein E2P81_ATG01339 [Venturia nashicola]|uniref:Uncharacterized protein n=1 Tax=Venturia nashicola TaxID=86259 RepID=A0A4Z1PUB5_9PEZI|nr:hypothetical protein E6O75_ATG01370 [Venturia nashicola]TLD38796.1 hypothetical protein E2P81_ATG01339 [Venturia nashicola]